jgi:hypothetical protein
VSRPTTVLQPGEPMPLMPPRERGIVDPQAAMLLGLIEALDPFIKEWARNVNAPRRVTVLKTILESPHSSEEARMRAQRELEVILYDRQPVVVEDNEEEEEPCCGSTSLQPSAT